MASGSRLGRLGLETEAEILKKFQECLEPLRQNGVQVDNFTISDMLKLGYLLHKLVKNARVLTAIPYKDVRDSVLAKANSLGICPLSHEMNLCHVVEVCSWMKTKSGIKTVVEVQRSEKLKRRASAKGKTVAELAILRAFNSQIAEYSSELMKPYALLQDSKNIHAKYWPASVFGIATYILDKDEAAVLEFCKKEDVKCRLYKYLEGLIDRKMKNYAIREAEKLQAVLSEMGCSEVLPSSTDGNCHVGEKRKNVDLVHCQNGETSSESNRVAYQKKV